MPCRSLPGPLARSFTRGLAAVVLGLIAGQSAQAQDIYSDRFGQQTGEDLYKGLCQGCHMADARGATGAGTYPALAHDVKLAAAIYPITVVVNGQRAMPSFGTPTAFFGQYLSDAQIANVLNYVRTHFGNHYTDIITTAQVAAAHPAAQHPAQPSSPSGAATTAH